MIIKIDAQQPDVQVVAQIAKILENNGLIAYPTDTIYGLGCDIFYKQGIERIYWLKGRNLKNPLSMMCADFSQISEYAQISNFAFKILSQYLPGPFTFILPAKQIVPKHFIPKQRTIGVRIPRHSFCLDLVRALGRPIITTSANYSGQPIFTSAEKIENQMGHSLDTVVDGGKLEGLASTVVSLINDQPKILRQGVGEFREG